MNKCIKMVWMFCIIGLILTINNITSIKSEQTQKTNILYNQVKNIKDFKNNFNKFNIVDSKKDDNSYMITFDNGLKVDYIINYDMFYIYGIDGNIKEFECMEEAQAYLFKVSKNII